MNTIVGEGHSTRRVGSTVAATGGSTMDSTEQSGARSERLRIRNLRSDEQRSGGKRNLLVTRKHVEDGKKLFLERLASFESSDEEGVEEGADLSVQVGEGVNAKDLEKIYSFDSSIRFRLTAEGRLFIVKVPLPTHGSTHLKIGEMLSAFQEHESVHARGAIAFWGEDASEGTYNAERLQPDLSFFRQEDGGPAESLLIVEVVVHSNFLPVEMKKVEETYLAADSSCMVVLLLFVAKFKKTALRRGLLEIPTFVIFYRRNGNAGGIITDVISFGNAPIPHGCMTSIMDPIRNRETNDVTTLVRVVDGSLELQLPLAGDKFTVSRLQGMGQNWQDFVTVPKIIIGTRRDFHLDLWKVWKNLVAGAFREIQYQATRANQ